MPEKNASKYLLGTAESIAEQTAREDMKSLIINTESSGGTLAELKEVCAGLRVDQGMILEEGRLHGSLYEDINSEATDYYSVMCSSDGNIADNYLEYAIREHDQDPKASDINPDIMTLCENGSICNGLRVRNVIRS